jgi:cell division protein FtsI/penicillin-binding protein 2
MYFFSLFITTYALAGFNFSKDLSFSPINKTKVSKKISKNIFKDNKLPSEVVIDKNKFAIEYSIDKKLNKKINKILRKYRSDHCAVAVIDNNSGEVISINGYQRKTKRYIPSLAMSATHPAASIFKIVTAADLIENTDVDAKTKYVYSGKGVTLYKSQLKNKKNRWSRKITLKDAFGYSNNVVFAKAAIKDSNFTKLQNTAKKFGFNTNICAFVDTPKSLVKSDFKDKFSIAELASGFNRETSLSAIHGAAIASVVANDGKLKRPKLVKSIYNKTLKRSYSLEKDKSISVVKKQTAKELRKLFIQTVKRGTAKSVFVPWKNRTLKNIEIGGKTGSISGGIPYGKRDWFVSYAKPKNSNDKGISVAVMIVNEKKWYVRAPKVANEIMKYYFKRKRI